MPYSPPKKATLILSLIFVLAGIILGLMALYGVVISKNDLYVVIGFGLTLIGWLIVYLGIITRGL